MLTPIDPAELPEASVTDDPALHTAVVHCRQCGKESECVCQHCESIDVEVDADSLSQSRPDIQRGQAVAVAKFCARLLEMGRSKTEIFKAVNAFAFAAHIHPEQGASMEAIAAKFRITKQAFSKLVNHYRDRLGLPRNGGAMSNKARSKFKRTATKAHERNKEKRTKHGFNRIIKDAHC